MARGYSDILFIGGRYDREILLQVPVLKLTKIFTYKGIDYKKSEESKRLYGTVYKVIEKE